MIGAAPILTFGQGFLGLDGFEWWTIFIAGACAVACAVPGVFLVLRRMAMLGDAISHAILPGLAAAFIFTGTRDVWAMLLGAAVTGLLTAAATSALARFGRVPEDAAMGVVFTSLFALGVLLISQVARDVDLDPGCVLYGQADLAVLDLRTVLGVEIPRTALPLAIAACLNVALAAVFFKELKITSFDPYLATTMGISAAAVHYALMGVVATTTVVSFEAVGAVLVVAMLIAPAATAQLLTHRLSRMLWLAGLSALLSAVAGFFLAREFSTNLAGMMSVVAGVQFTLAVLFSPRQGVAVRVAQQLGLAMRIRREDILGALYRASERGEGGAPRRGGLAEAAAVALLRAQGHVRGRGGAMALTPAGMDHARRVIRSHRLWETYLNERLGLPPDHVHDPSERMEHFITPAMERALREEFEGRRDPQGRDIPG